MGTSITFIQQVDTLLVGYFLTDVSVGVYDAAYIVSKLVTLLVPATVGIALPLLSSLDADERTTEMGRLYRLATKWTILLTFPVFVVLVTVPGRVISLIFNSSYADGSTTLLILAVGFLSMVFAAIARQMLIAVGETTLLLGSSLFALGGNLVLNLALIPSLGIEGAAIATTVSLGSLGLFYVFYLYRRSGVFPLSGALLKTTALSGFGFYAADRFVFAVDSLGSPLFLFVCFLFAITHFSIFVLSGGLVPADIEFIEQLEKKLPFDASGFVRILRRWVS
jgi:O-antigen/teichoic acid export membrane protein